MKGRQHLFLQLRLQVGQHAPATNQVQPGEGGILSHVVACKETRHAEGGGDTVLFPLLHEETAQTVSRYVEQCALRVGGSPGFSGGFFVEVRAEDLDRPRAGLAA